MTESVTKAVATVEKATPGSMIRTHADSFTAVLPTHIKPDTWVRLAQGALKKGKVVQIGGEKGTELELAALNNPAVFMASLLDAARLGLEPGTEQYYLTPRKVKGRLEILGIVGYQGYIELMYRAGAISSVVAEVVYSGDKFDFQPGRHERPDHQIDWDAESRGTLRLVYAYAVMKDGATSKVVVLNRAAINKIKESSQGSSSEYSPWQKHEAAMWLKSAVRQLAKWVPTSAEYVREQLRAQVEVAAEQRPEIPPAPDVVKHLDESWTETDADGNPIVDAEFVDNDYRDDDPDLAGGAR
jgi:recombination protein RecT